MRVHEEAQASILARARWNQTSLALVAGETYEFVATGCWTDFFIPHGPAGDPSDSAYLHLFERWGRVPFANWFTLIGAIDEQPEEIVLKAELARFERPLPMMAEYDQLLQGGGL